jgi:hypothetical protein
MTLRRRTTGQSSYRRSGPRIRGPGSPVRRGRSGCATSPTRRADSSTVSNSPRPAGGDSEPHRRPGGGGPASAEPLHGAAC